MIPKIRYHFIYFILSFSTAHSYNVLFIDIYTKPILHNITIKSTQENPKDL